MFVRATAKGLYGQLRQVGEIFEISNAKNKHGKVTAFADTWMEAVDTDGDYAEEVQDVIAKTEKPSKADKAADKAAKAETKTAEAEKAETKAADPVKDDEGAEDEGGDTPPEPESKTEAPKRSRSRRGQRKSAQS